MFPSPRDPAAPNLLELLSRHSLERERERAETIADFVLESFA